LPLATSSPDADDEGHADPDRPDVAGAGPAARVRSSLQDEGVDDGTVSTLRTDKPVANAGWSKLLVRRGDMTRVGSTSGKDWTTVKAIRLSSPRRRRRRTVQFDTSISSPTP
jgi:hypothetical protein